jgi:hypothetical protein
MQCSRAKSQFLLQTCKAKAWDRLNAEVVNLPTCKAKTYRHADEAEQMTIE